MSTRQYKNLKGLKKENLRDNMSTLELALNMLAEATTTELTKVENPEGLEENLQVQMQDETVWLTQAQMIELFGRDQSVISRHITNAFKEGKSIKKAICIFCILQMRTDRLLFTVWT